METLSEQGHLSTLRYKQYGKDFTNDIFKRSFFKENFHTYFDPTFAQVCS